MAKKLFIRTFGCQMNEYDSDKMADVLAASEDIVKTDTPEDADIILFNTCSVREKAQERVFHDLGRVRLLKQAVRRRLVSDVPIGFFLSGGVDSSLSTALQHILALD